MKANQYLQANTSTFALLTLLFAWSATSCTDNFMKQKIDNQTGKGGAGKTTLPDGTVSQSTNANYAGTQIVSAPATSAVAGSQIVFPSGSLAISAVISLGNGATVASNNLATGLGINTAITNTGVPVAIGSDPNQDTNNPFTLSIPLPKSSSLADSSTVDKQNIIVIFERFNATDKTYTSGVIASDQFEISGSLVTFQTVNFGTFQAAYTKDKVTASVSKAGKAADLANLKPALTITGISASAAKNTYYAGDTILMNVKLSAVVNISGSTSGLTLGLNCSLSPATYQSGTGTDTLVFAYTVKANDSCAKLDQSGTVLTVGSAIIASDAASTTPLTLPVSGSAASLAVLSPVAVDGMSPVVTLSTFVQPTTGTAGTATVSASSAFSGLIFYSDAACSQSISTAVSSPTQSITLNTQNPGSQIQLFVKAKDATATYTSPCRSLNQILVTPNMVSNMTAASGAERHTFFDGTKHWAFWMTAGGITHGYSDNGGKTFVSNSTTYLGVYGSRFAVSYKNGFVAVAFTLNSGGNIYATRGALNGNGRAWTWDTPTVAMNGNYSKPTVTIGSDDRIYVGGIYAPTIVNAQPKVAVSSNTTSSVIAFGSVGIVTGSSTVGTSIDSMVLIASGNSSSPTLAFVSIAGGIREYIYNGTAWTQFSGGSSDWTLIGGMNGLDGAVNTSVIYHGSLFVGGFFGYSGTGPLRGVAQWNGSNWVGQGLSFPANTEVKVLAVSPDGSLYAGGYSTSVPFVKKLVGATWTDVGTAGFSTGYVGSLGFDAQGNLYAGGTFASTDSNMSLIAKFNIATSTWSNMGTGTNAATGAGVTSIVQYGTQMIIGGSISQIRGVAVTSIAGYDPNTNSWSSMGDPCTSVTVTSLLTTPTGNLYAACQSVYGVKVRISGSGTWTSVGSLTASINAMIYDRPTNALYVALNTNFSACPLNAAGTSCTSTWSTMSGGAGGIIYTLAMSPQRRLFMGGSLSTTPSSNTASNAFEYDFVDGAYTAMGVGFAGPSGPPPIVRAVTSDTNGNIFVGGSFTSINGVVAMNVAKWNQSTGWTAMGTGAPYGVGSATDTVYAIATDGTYLYAAGSIASLSNIGACLISSCATWSTKGVGGLTGGIVLALATDGTNLYAGSTDVTYPLQKFISSSFSGFGASLSGTVVSSIAIIDSSNVYIGGTSGSVPVLKKCSSGSCISVGPTSFSGGTFVNALAYDGSHLYVGGNFSAVVSSGSNVPNTAGIAMYDSTNTTWSGLVSSSAGLGGSPNVTGLALDGGGRLYVSGSFTSAGGLPTPGLASWYSGAWYTAGSAALGITALATNRFSSTSTMYPLYGIGPLGVYAYDATLVGPRATAFSVAAAGTNAMLAYSDARTQMPMAKQFNGSSWTATSTQIGSAPVTGGIWAASSSDGTQNAVLWESSGSIFSKSNRASASVILTPPNTSWSFPNLAEAIVDGTSFVSAIFSGPPASDGSAVITGIGVP